MAVHFTIGCDPEFFLQKEGAYVASIPYVDGMKGDPQPLGRGNGVMVDNVALEFCTPPAMKEAKFVRTVKHAISSIRAMLPEDVKLVAMASARFPISELEHPICQEFGCDPDFNAYKDGAKNNKPSLMDKQFRSCGGHIHVGHAMLKDQANRITMIKLMDAIHGLVSTILDSGASSVERRKLYGKAGCFRPTEYGVEYRTLSNYWCKAPELTKLMYRCTRDAISMLAKGKAGIILDSIDLKELEKTINTGDRGAALEMFATKVAQHLSSHTNELFMEVSKKVFSFESSWND